MKKLYAIAFAAVLALGASATNPSRQAAVALKPVYKAELQTLPLAVQTPATAQSVGFTSLDEVNGDYTWNYYGLLNGDSGDLTGLVTLTVTNAETGEVTIEGIFSASSTGLTGKITGTVDLAAGTLTVANKQDLGADSYGDQNYFYIKEIDEEGELVDGASSVESIQATISGKTFTFPEEYVFAVGDFNDENLGWWKLTAFNEFTEYVEPDDLLDLTEWTEFSTATMTDGWIIPVLTYQSGDYADPADFPLNVDVLQNKEDENLFALVNPYLKASGFPQSSGSEGYIVLDLTDPEFVLVAPGVFSGYTNGSNRLFCINVESFYVGQGYSKEIIQTALGSSFPEWSTSTIDGDKTVVSIPNCRFNYPGATDKCYAWTNRADAMKATITINRSTSSVANIAVEGSNAAPVYYNLQGVRVANPENGIFIEVRGDKAVKVLK